MIEKLPKILVCMILACVCLSACQSQEKTMAERYWSEANKAEDFEEYIKEHMNDMDVEALRQEAENVESSLSQQFKATVLLCELECQSLLAADESLDPISYDEITWKTKAEAALLRYDYPDSSSYAEAFLTKVNSEGDAFWAAVTETVHYPYDYLLPLVAAADQLDEQTLVNLRKGLPEDKSYARELGEALEKWVEANQEQTLPMYEALEEAGFYGEWSCYDWKSAYFYDSLEPYDIQAETVDDALAYITNIRESLLPRMESEFGAENFSQDSYLTEEAYFNTELAVTVAEELGLQEPDEENLPETIEWEGKKVIAFYRNINSPEDFWAAPTSLRIMGDFMLGLSEDEYPESAAEADYYLVLTPSYQYGNYYQDGSGNDTEIQEVFANTSIDLYEAGTGRFLRHLGTVAEEPDSRIVASYYDNAPIYPEETTSDVLAYIYRHINEPDAYITLVDNTGGKTEFQRDEPVVLGTWEITYHSAEVTDEYGGSILSGYTPEKGCKFIKAQFTITNVGTESSTFLTMSGRDEDMDVAIADMANEEYYLYADNIMMGDNYLAGEFVDGGETVEGELIFQVPEETAQNMESLYLLIAYKRQLVGYPVE